MNQSKRELIKYLDNLNLALLGVLFLAFPLLFTSITTDAFALPKQLLLCIAVIICMVVFGVRTVIERNIKLRTSPFDLPLVILTIVFFVSAILAVNRYDALTSFLPVFLAILSYFVIINSVRSANALLFLLGALVVGAGLSSMVTILSFFKIYVLPFAYSHNQAFNTYGSLLDQAMYLGLMLPVAGYFAYPLVAPYLSAKTRKSRVSAESPFEKSKSESIST